MLTPTFRLALLLLLSLTLPFTALAREVFPDGTPIPDWFRQNQRTDITKLGKHYRITDFNVANDSTRIQTQLIQAVIDKAAVDGGGVIIIPKGVFLSGSLFFKKNTHLHLEAGGKLKGSDDINNFPLVMTRM